MDARPIEPSTRVVVIGDGEPLARLSSAMPHLNGWVEFRRSEEFLRPLLMETQDQEAGYRAITGLYASLRKKLVVRLVFLNLNPEVCESPAKLLDEVVADWNQISLNRRKLLKEKQREGMRFVTILVTEEGDWSIDLRGHLDALSGRPGGDSPHDHAEELDRQTCFLLGRQLELGEGEPLFAIDHWPRLVGGLVQFLALDTQDAQHCKWTDGGLFAWRIQRFILPENPEQLQVDFRHACITLEKKILDDSKVKPAPLFDPILLDANYERFNRKALDEELKRLFERPWQECGRLEIHELESSNQWNVERAVYSLACRAQFGLPDENLEESRTLEASLQRAESSPASLNPGSLPEFKSETIDPKAGLLEVEAKREKLERSREVLNAYLEEQERARRAWPGTRDLLTLGFLVSVTFSYAVLLGWLSLAYVLPFAGFSVLTGALFAACGVAGIGVMLYLSQRLQDWRGEIATEALLQTASKAVIDARVQVYESLGNLVQRGGQERRRFLRRLAQELFHERLRRADYVLRHELQHNWKGDRSLSNTQTHCTNRHQSRLTVGWPLGRDNVDQESEVFNASELRPVDLDEQDIEALEGHFLELWADYLKVDSRRRALLPYRPILKLNAAFVQEIQDKVRARANERLREHLNSDRRRLQKMLDEAEEKLGLLHNAKFFSVDLQTEAQPDRAILVDQSFAREFHSTWDSATTCHAVESPDQELGPGVIAIWYGRAAIDAVPDPSTGSLTFTQTGRQ